MISTEAIRIQLQPMKPAERKYAYTAKSNQMLDITGCLGMYSCEVLPDGPGWCVNWISFDAKHGNDPLPALRLLLSELRSKKLHGSCLSNLTCMKAFCEIFPESKFERYRNRAEYGFRADTQQFSFMIRLVPSSPDMNCFIYAYHRAKLNEHIRQASRNGIRFYEPNTHDLLFRMDDDDMVGIRTEGHETQIKRCRYVDGSTIEVDGQVMTARSFVSEMGCEIFPIRQSLPRRCFYYQKAADQIMEIERGDIGMSVSMLDAIPTPDGKESQVDAYNRQLGVSKAQEAAMYYGANFSWADPEADPRMYA